MWKERRVLEPQESEDLEREVVSVCRVYRMLKSGVSKRRAKPSGEGGLEKGGGKVRTSSCKIYKW